MTPPLFRIPLLLAQAAQPAAGEDLLETGLRFTQAAAIYLGCAFGVYLCLLVLGRVLKHRFQVPLSWLYHIFCVLAALYLPTLLPFVDFANGEDHLEAALAITAAFVLVRLFRHYFFDPLLRKGAGAQVPKFLGEFVSIAIIVTAVLLVLQFIYHQKIPGLLAGAGIIGIVLGLALQDTLGNIFSGFAIYFGGQFKAGDWLLVEDKHAQIVEINWRSTRLRTDDDICLDIPNNNITKQTVVNFTFPTNIHGIRLDIGLEYDAPPYVVKKVLIEAALDCPLVLRQPAPDVYLTEFGDFSITYQLRFWLDDHIHFHPANSQIRMNLWYALRRHGIKIPYPIQQEFHMDPPALETENLDSMRSSLQKAIFAPALSPAQLEEIVENAKIVRFGQGERLIRQGADAGPMYIIIRGKAEVWIESQNHRTSVAILGPDACIGENSVLTGEKRIATIVALEDCLAVEVDKATLAKIVSASPDLLDSLSELLTQRRMKNEGLVAEAEGSAANQATRSQYKAGFLGTLRQFFQV